MSENESGLSAEKDAGLKRPCRHEESLYGRCTTCGQTWEQQAIQREKDALVRLLARHVLSHVTPEHCTADCMAGAILSDGWTRVTPPEGGAR